MRGSTIRRIRLDKCIKAKDLYKDVMTKAHYIQFEKNLVDISSSKFFEIVDRLNMSFEEIEFIEETYNVKNSVKIWREYAYANNLRDVKSLEEIANKYEGSYDYRSRVIAYLSKITSQNIRNLTIDTKYSDFIVLYLTQIDVWSLDEISIFTASFYLFNINAQRNLMGICFKHMNKYLNWKNYRERMMNLLSNYVCYCYLNKRVDEGDSWLEELIKIPIDTSTVYQGYYCELCKEVYNHIHTKTANRSNIIAMDHQIKLLLGKSTLLEEFDKICSEYV